METPDFGKLGRESPHPAAAWESAWRLLYEDEKEKLWPTILNMSFDGYDPVKISRVLTKLDLGAYFDGTDGSSSRSDRQSG